MKLSIRCRSRLTVPLALMGLVVGVAAVGVVAAQAVDPAPPVGITGSDFEIRDGNTAVDDDPSDTSATTRDWDSLNTNLSDTHTATIKTDEPPGASDNSFGNGTKEDTAVPSVIDGSIPPNKSDLMQFGSWTEKVGVAQFLHLFWTRVQDPSGTTNMDFEFNKNACVVGGSNNVCSSNGVTPVRSNNDLLITYDLSRGGTEAKISLRRWSGTGNAWGGVVELDAALAWGSVSAAGITSSLLGDDYSARTFGEASINLAAIFGTTTCDSFGSAYLKSRSSDSFTSAVKDFIAPVAVNLSNCGSIAIEKADDRTPPVAVANATFAVHSSSGATAPVLRPTTTTLASGLDDSSTSVSVVDASKIPAGTALIKVGTEWMRVTARSGNTLTVERGASPNGTATTTAAAHSPGATVSAMASCTTTGAAASQIPGTTGTVATCNIPDLPYASYWVVETKAPAGYQRSTAIVAVNLTPQTSPVRILFTNNRAPSTVVITKVDDTLGPLGDAVFRLYNDVDNSGTKNAGDTSTSYTCTTKRSDNATTAEPFGTCKITGINEPGAYIVHEDTPPAGYDGAADQALPIALGSTYDLANMVGHGVFQDLRRYTVIVLVCRESDHKLYGSTVALPTPTPTVTSVLASNLGGSDKPTEAQLCGANGLSGLTGTSVYPGKHGGTHNPSISITPTPVPVPVPTATATP